MASTPEHCGQCPEVSVAETQCSGCLFSVQPYGHHSRVRTEGGASGCWEDEKVPSQTGDCKQKIITDFISNHCDKIENTFPVTCKEKPLQMFYDRSWRGPKWDLKESTQCWNWLPKASCCRLCSMQCSVAGKGSYQKEPILGESTVQDLGEK